MFGYIMAHVLATENCVSYETGVDELKRRVGDLSEEELSLSDFSMYIRSSRDRCFWLPGMRLLIKLLPLPSEEPERLYHRNMKE